MKIYIKNMVCNRCIMVVENELKSLGYQSVDVHLGSVTLNKSITEKEKEEIHSHLQKFGFELINDKQSKLIGKIKGLLIDLIYSSKHKGISENLSEYLTKNLHQDYSSLSNLYSKVEGTTIEKFFINLKIERVKELLLYDEISLKEIASILNYSSTAHLSNQFKKVTGLTPSHFKKLKEDKRKSIDEL